MKGLGGWCHLVLGLAVALLVFAYREDANAAPPPRGLGVFVITAGELQNGLVEKEEADSCKDLEGKLRQGRKNVWLAPSRETAQLVVVIAGRGMADSGAYIPGSTTTTVTANKYNNSLTAKTTSNPDTTIYVTNVRADLYLWADGRHLRAFLGDGLTWKGAANDVAKQIDSWVGLNQPALARMVAEAQNAAAMKAVEAAFRARHPDLTPEIERQIVDLGNSGVIVPGNMTADEFLEKLYQVVMSRHESDGSALPAKY